MNAQAKTINLLLYDGSLSGVISIEDSSWNSGELYSAPRDSVDDLLSTDACKKYGVYLLLSADTVYIGQSSDLAKRITQHKVGKLWWDSVVILTTKDDSLNHSDIDYLETILIDRAQSVGKLDCDNKKKGNPAKVDRFRSVYLGQYLEEALFLMRLIGINVFAGGPAKSKKTQTATPLAITLDTQTKLALGKRVKKEAIQFLTDSGLNLSKDVTYAVKQERRPEYWANPNVELLDKDWWIILNDNVNYVLTVLHVPACNLKLSSGSGSGLIARNDKPNMIDIKFVDETLVDQTSKIDFSPYLVKRISYGSK